MAYNFVNRGEVLTLVSMGPRGSGNPYRERGFNGVALIDAAEAEPYTFQIRGTFEFAMPDIEVGDLIHINEDNEFTKDGTCPVYGRAVTSSDEDGNFHCMILQSE